jgi:hypothetical protein
MPVVQRCLLLFLSGVGALHFCGSLWWWLTLILPMVAASGQTDPAPLRGVVLDAVMCAAFLALYLGAFVLAFRGNKRSRTVWVGVFIGCCLAFFNDVKRQHYQVGVMDPDRGCQHLYATWWWYNDRPALLPIDRRAD